MQENSILKGFSAIKKRKSIGEKASAPFLKTLPTTIEFNLEVRHAPNECHVSHCGIRVVTY